MTTVADSIAGVVTPLFDGPLPVNVRAWDGSTLAADDPAAPTVIINSPDALRRMLWAPGEIGLSRAYVTGELDVEGDLADAFRRIWAATRSRNLKGRIRPGTLLRAAKAAYSLGAVKR